MADNFRFNYTKYKTTKISLDKLDQLAESVFGDAPKTTFGTIVSMIKLVVALTYIYARWKLVDEALLLAKQEYEQNQHNANQGELGNDNLGSQPKK